QETNKKALAIHVSGLLYERPYEYHSLRRAILMQINGTEASGQAWRDGSPKCMAAMEPRAINDRSGSKPAML
ncbi:hypothetical protein Q3C01_09045, partial [Bradyrhizobium sp. UFLA05-109]